MEQDRMKWKDEFSQKTYGKSYISLCSDRKRIVDQIYILTKTDVSRKCK